MSVAAYDKDFKEGKKILTVKDLEAARFIRAYAEHLKRQGRFELPKWGEHVKTGVSKELAPYDPDWLYTRAASVARKIYIRANQGVGGFSKVYGGKYRRGTQTNRFQKGSRKVISYCIRQLQTMDIVKEASSGGGQEITKEGQRELDTVANQEGLKEAVDEEGEEDGGDEE